MNYFYKRHVWLIPLYIIVIWGIWATQVVNAQVDIIDLTASPDSLPITSSDIVTVTITYTVTEPTQLFYYLPVDFEVVDNGGAVSDLDPSINSEGRLKWNVEGSGAKEVTLRVKDDATSGEKMHRVSLNDIRVEKVLTIEPAEAISVQSADPNLQINEAYPEPELVEAGQPFTVTIVIQNNGPGLANDVKVNLTSASMELEGNPSFSIDSIEVGQPITKSHSFGTSVTTADGPHSITVTLPNEETPYATEVITITVKQPPQNPVLELVDEYVYGSDPGKRGLQLRFQNNGSPLSPDDQLILSFQPENLLTVKQAQLNEIINPGQLIEGRGHAWSELPAENIFVLDITDLLIEPGFTSETDLKISFIDSGGGALGSPISLSSDTIAELAKAIPALTPTPTITSSPTATATPASVFTSVPEDNEGDEDTGLLEWLLIGMIVVAVLLLVAIGIYLLLKARKQANSKKDKEETKKGRVMGSGGIPYLQASNGRSFPITTFPFTIGRGESNNLIIDETFPQWESMSRIHAQIVQHQQGYVIEDLGSQNKLRVQGRLTDRNLLRNDWQILIGGVEFTFFDGSSTPGGSA